MTVTSVPGFKAYGIHCGVKDDGILDLAYIGTVDNTPAMAAAVFTSNKLCAAPVTLTREHLNYTDGQLVGVVVNSGNANAATGDDGYKNAIQMAETTAHYLEIDRHYIAVSSTGLIGYQLPIEKICDGIPSVVQQASVDGGDMAARAIMTTDTVEKTFFQEFHDSHGNAFTIGGIAKGAAMLQPHMATMLAYITTDAQVHQNVLQSALSQAVEYSFNRLSVDGAQSTNDTVLVLSSSTSQPIDEQDFTQSLTQACQSLAKQMCDDAEGSTHTVRIEIQGASSDAQAAVGARRVANCQLVKCSWFGNDAYWGRVAAELGASGIDYDFSALTISYGDNIVLQRGVSLIDGYTDEQRQQIRDYMSQREITLTVDLGLGQGTDWILTNDLSFGYIEENMGTS